MKSIKLLFLMIMASLENMFFEIGVATGCIQCFAKIKFGALVVAGRGKIGGHVLSRNKGGAYIRTKVTPNNPSSTDQVTIRNNFTASSQAWKGLTAAQRLEWNNAVMNFVATDIFGDQKVLSGFQLYCRINNNLRLIGGTPITTPPTPAAVPAFTSFSAAAANGAQTVTLTYAPAIGATETVVVYGTAALSPGVSFVKSELRKFDTILTADASPFSIETEYIAKFGAVGAAGQKIFFEMQQIVTLTGLSGAKIRCSAVIS